VLVPVRVLVVDDQLPFRRAMTAVVEATVGFEVVGEAASGRSPSRSPALCGRTSCSWT
jgi:DNA-binding NarL/FixJ family response regulator